MAEKISEFKDKLTMFENGFKAIASNIEQQLDKVNKEIDKLVENTKVLPKIKKDNKELFNNLNNVSATLGELLRRLNLIEQNQF